MAIMQVQIDKLIASNYSNWQIDTKYFLLECNAWNIVTRDKKEPEDDAEKGVTAKNVRDFKSKKACIVYNIFNYRKGIMENHQK